jgi:hypothetical protein
MISKKHISYFISGIIAFSVLAQSPLNETRSIVEKWVETRQLTSQLKADWLLEKEVLAQSIEVFESELQSINARMEKVDTGNSQTTSELDVVIGEQKDLTIYSTHLKNEATRLEERLRDLARQLPVGLRDRLAQLLERIPQKPEETKISIAARIQNILGIINEVDKFNGSVSVVSELRKNQSGAEVQVQVLYVGLAQAYFADPSGEFAGIGRPGEDGWDWEILPELASKIRQAIEIYQGSQAAAFVQLPIQLK